jgi:hypothetical protein
MECQHNGVKNNQKPLPTIEISAYRDRSMPSPFPGMDPYLEHPSAWFNIHHRLITAIADDLAPQLLPKYQVLVEERIYQVENQDAILVGATDVLVQQLRSDVEASAVATATPSIEPISVTLTIPETMRQGYF